MDQYTSGPNGHCVYVSLFVPTILTILAMKIERAVVNDDEVCFTFVFLACANGLLLFADFL